MRVDEIYIDGRVIARTDVVSHLDRQKMPKWLGEFLILDSSSTKTWVVEG